jgi:hypothetical protein
MAAILKKVVSNDQCFPVIHDDNFDPALHARTDAGAGTGCRYDHTVAFFMTGSVKKMIFYCTMTVPFMDGWIEQ